MSCGVMPFRVRPPSRRLLKVLLFPPIRNGAAALERDDRGDRPATRDLLEYSIVQPPPAATEGQVVGAAHVDAHAAGR